MGLGEIENKTVRRKRVRGGYGDRQGKRRKVGKKKEEGKERKKDINE